MEQIDILNMYWDLIQDASVVIPVDKLRVITKLSLTDIAAVHYRGLGYDVCRLHEYNEWTEDDKAAISKVVPRPYFNTLKRILRDSARRPTLMLIQDNELAMFVEVMTESENIRAGVVELFIRYGGSWPVRILRIVNKEAPL